MELLRHYMKKVWRAVHGDRYYHALKLASVKRPSIGGLFPRPSIYPDHQRTFSTDRQGAVEVPLAVRLTVMAISSLAVGALYGYSKVMTRHGTEAILFFVLIIAMVLSVGFASKTPLLLARNSALAAALATFAYLAVGVLLR